MAILSTLESSSLHIRFKMVHFNINLKLVNLKCTTYIFLQMYLAFVCDNMTSSSLVLYKLNKDEVIINKIQINF